MQDALRYLEAVLPPSGLRVIASKPPHWSKGLKHDFLATNEEAVALSQRLDADGVEHWVALATYASPEGGRKAENTVQLQCLWVDLDYKHYASPEEGDAAMQDFYKAVGYPSVTVKSGGGLHAYWVLRAPLPTVQWKILAEAFQAKWQTFPEILKGADPISADAARVLRLPGSHNHKYDPPREVVIETFEDVTYDATALVAKLGAIVPKAGTKKPAIDINDDLGANLEQRPSYIQPMLQKCLQLQHAFTHQAQAIEPYWYATIQLVRHVEDGRRIAHAFSNQHPGYSAGDTDAKLDQLESKGIGPTTCAKFKQLNPSGCQGCQFSITSPIQLGYKEVEGVEPTITVTEKTITAEGDVVEVEKLERPAVEMPQGFKFDGQQIYRVVIDDETKLKRDEPILQGFICPERIINSERTSGTEIQMFVQINGQPPKRIQVPGKVMAEKRDLGRELNSKGVFFMSKDSSHILELLQRMTQSLQRRTKDAPMAEQMGWQDDKSFVVGSTAYRGDQPPQFDLPVPASTKPVVKRYEPAGSLEEWKRTAEIYNRPGGEPYQFALLYGLAGVFLPITKVSGVMLSLYSQQAGRGKSTVGYGALSWWGDPDGLKSQSKDTNNALYHKASRHKNLPILMDEVTDKPTWELEDLVYFMTQGREKESLTADRTARPVLPGWALPAISTANNSLRTRLQSKRGDSQGLLARIIELSFDLPFAEELAYADRMVLRRGFADNYGHAGPKVVRYVQENRDTIESMMDQLMAKFDVAVDGDSAYRFWVASCAATIAGLTVARHIGLLNYDVSNLTQWVVNMLHAQREDAVTQIAGSDEVLAQFLESNANRIVVSYQAQIGTTTAPRIWPEDGVRGSELVGRVELAERSMYLSMPAFIRFCNDKGYDIGSFIRNAAATVTGGEALLKKPGPVSINLGKGTKNASARLKALEFNLLHPSLREFAQGIDQRVGEANNLRSVK